MLHNRNEPKHFWSLATYMRKYVIDFAKIVAPMIHLLKGKFERMTLTSDCHARFEENSNISPNLEDYGSLAMQVGLVHGSQ